MDENRKRYTFQWYEEGKHKFKSFPFSKHRGREPCLKEVLAFKKEVDTKLGNRNGLRPKFEDREEAEDEPSNQEEEEETRPAKKQKTLDEMLAQTAQSKQH